MLELKPFAKEAMVEIRPLLATQDYRTCDNTVGGLYMWREYFKQLYTVVNGMLVCTAEYLDMGTCFSMPLGNGDIYGALAGIKGHCEEKSIPLRFCCVTPDALVRLTDEAGRAYEILGRPSEIKEYRDWADYLYPYENFLGYHGKKLVTQRNHRNRFLREYPQYEYKPLTSKLIPEAKAFLTENAGAFEKDSPLAREDYIRALELLDLVEYFGFTGGLLFIGGKAVGLTVGEAMGDTLYVHIEKALKEYKGAYPMLAMLYAQQNACPALKYINREDDSGDAGLRYSKLEYQPCDIITKYVVCY